MKTIKKLTAIAFILFGMVAYTNAQSFVVSKDQSIVKWNGKKVGGEHYGTIKFSSGTLQVSNGQVNTGVFEMDMTSIVCEDITNEGTNQRLVNHLKSDDFFSVESHPTSRMTITGVKKTSGNDYEFSGNLTIKGITNPITFKATTEVSGSTLRASGVMVVDRAKYDIKFRSGSFFQNLGDNLIYDDFTLDFSLVANAQ
jgi:polyisoprenoid-binding protein YceI